MFWLALRRANCSILLVNFQFPVVGQAREASQTEARFVQQPNVTAAVANDSPVDRNLRIQHRSRDDVQEGREEQSSDPSARRYGGPGAVNYSGPCTGYCRTLQ